MGSFAVLECDWFVRFNPRNNVSFAAPYGPIPEIGFNELTVRSILILNTLLQISCIYLLFQKDIKEYFKKIKF